MELENYLKNLGLDKREIKTYLALLELGESMLYPIAHKVNEPISTTSHVLQRLEGHGLVNILIKNNRQSYSPTEPEKILSKLREKADKMKQRAESFKEVLPELSNLYKFYPFQPKVRLFKGQDIRNIYSEMLEVPIDEVYHVGEIEKIIAVVGNRFLKNIVKKRAELHIKSKSLRVKKYEAKDEFYFKGDDTRSIKYLPERFKSPTHVMIYGDNVALISTGKESLGLVITSREYAETMMSWFRELWSISSSK